MKHLEFLNKYIEANQPKFELQCLYVDNDNLVATDTRVLIIKKLVNAANIQTLLHKELIKTVLKANNTKILKVQTACYKENSITVNNIEFRQVNTILGTYPNYARIKLKNPEHKIVTTKNIRCELDLIGVQIADNWKYFLDFIGDKRDIIIKYNSLITQFQFEFDDYIIIAMPISR